jgi:hypothetical protein
VILLTIYLAVLLILKSDIVIISHFLFNVTERVLNYTCELIEKPDGEDIEVLGDDGRLLYLLIILKVYGIYKITDKPEGRFLLLILRPSYN